MIIMTGHKCLFPCQPPEGSFFAPGPCRCGKTYLRSQAERMLREALAAMDATEPDDRVGYEYETVTDLRRGLVSSAAAWQETADRHHAARKDSAAAADAYVGNLMAGNCSYTLAAVLGVAGREYGLAVAKRLAWITASLIADGDSDDLNADITPASNVPGTVPGSETERETP